jgi:putative tricarboxylic transport membrane protein
MLRLAPKEPHPIVLEPTESKPTPAREPAAVSEARGSEGVPADPDRPASGLSQDLGAGLLLIVLAAIAGWQGSSLTLGTPRQIGPGLLPSALALLTGLCGVALALRGIAGKRTETIGQWGVKAPLVVLGAAVFFGLTIRSVGLLVAGPGVVFIASMASSERRWREPIVFALSMTLFCVVLFKLLLQLPIPLLPALIGY